MSAPARAAYARCLQAGLARLRARVLPGGDLPTYRAIRPAGRLYAPCPALAALMHDALAAFDPTSAWSRPRALLGLPPAARAQASAAAAGLRRGLRAFLAAHEEADGTWRFHGRASGLDADAATTALAASALLDAPRGSGRAARHVQALRRFRAHDGYVTFVAGDGARYAWLDAAGRRVAGIDRVVNAHVLAFLGLAGEAEDALAARLLAEAAGGALEDGSPEHPDPLAFVQAVARAWRRAERPDRARLAQRLVPWTLARRRDDGGFGGPLASALALLALVDLGYDGDALDAAAGQLLDTASPDGEWDDEPYLRQGHGSGPFSTALALGALGAWAARRGGAA